MPAPPSTITSIDGTLDFSGGVDSNRVTTIQSAINANGMPRNMLPWLVNGTVRNGGIRPRSGWNNNGVILKTPGLFQGAFMYEPLGANPYIVFLMSGVLYAIMDLNNPSAVTDLTGGNGLLHMPPTQTEAFFQQAEEFLIVQAGDYTTLPLFWDGAILRRSNGITGNITYPNINEIPAAGPMCYYMGRLWYAQGRVYSAGDIVNNQASGTAPYNFRDSVLKVTENPLAIGGDGFTVPSVAGNIRAIDFSSNLNSLLGQGTLYIFTRQQIYALTVPVTRTDWIAADNKTQPLQYVVQISHGSVNDRCIVSVNGDLFYQTLQPSIQSLTAAVRNFQQWGDTPVSINENRLLAFNDRALLYAASGIYFDNRMIQTAIPRQTANGVVHDSLVPLNFDTISSFANKNPPAWEGQLSGLSALQLLQGDFGGLDRAFALVISQIDGSLQLWELTIADRTDNGDNRINWAVEFPAFTWGKEFQLKELVSLELWIDDLRGTADITVDYRPDSDSCWRPWSTFTICTARNNEELLGVSTPYPTQYGAGYKSTITLPHPPTTQCAAFTGRPAYMGYQFQPRMQIHVWCRIRGVFLHSAERVRELYAGKVC
jgi:hypothetical protein